MQSYLNSHMKSEHKDLLFSLRSRTLRNIKCNFSSFYQSNLMCPICDKESDTQEHVMNCHLLLEAVGNVPSHVTYIHIFGTLEKQIEITSIYSTLLTTRNNILNDSLPGQTNTGP